MTKDHFCHLCDKGFSRAYDLKRHERDKHGDKRLNTEMKSYNRADPPHPSTVTLQHPFTCMVSGPTGSGKTKWVEQLLMDAQQMIAPPPDRIIWCYGQWQPIYDKLLSAVPGIEFYKGIPVQIDSSTFFDKTVNNIFVLDDMMTEVRDDPRISNLFSKGSHHLNLSVVYIVQNIFNQGKMARNISLNTQYLVLFKSPRDKQQIMVLARQLYPRRTDNFLNTYEEATKRYYGYLFIDLKPYTPDDQRLKTNILPQEATLPNPLINDHYGRVAITEPIQNLAHSVQNFVKGQSIVQPPQVAQVVRLDQQINDVLDNSNLFSDEKASLYSQLLLRKQNYMNKIRDNVSNVNQHSGASSMPNISDSQLQSLNDMIQPSPPVELTPQQTPVESLVRKPLADSGIGTASTSFTPQDVFEPLRNTIRQKQDRLKEKEDTPSRPTLNPWISLLDDDKTKQSKIRQAQQTQQSEIRKRILEDPSSFAKTWITAEDDHETRQKKKRLAEKRERKARQTYTPSDY